MKWVLIYAVMSWPNNVVTASDHIIFENKEDCQTALDAARMTFGPPSFAVRGTCVGFKK